MRKDSRQIIHMGINFIVAPPPVIDARMHVTFQNSLISSGIEFTNTAHVERQIEVVREEQHPLRVLVSRQSQAPVGQLLIVAPYPARPLELFAKEAEAVAKAYCDTWPTKPIQVISRDVTIRDLYQTTDEHAFQELWEMRLRQRPEALAAFGRPVLGGGLRFVMPPVPNEPEPTEIEVKIESYLRNPRMMFVEVQFKWPQPTPPGEEFDPTKRLQEVNSYIENQVMSFIMGEAR